MRVDHLSGGGVERIYYNIVVIYMNHHVVLWGFEYWLTRHGGSS
jgi:hypothetical protein